MDETEKRKMSVCKGLNNDIVQMEWKKTKLTLSLVNGAIYTDLWEDREGWTARCEAKVEK